MNNLKDNWSECKGIEAKARKDSKDSSKHLMRSRMQSMTLKRHKISRSCCHSGDFQGNNVRRLMAPRTIVFDENKTYLNDHEPDDVSIKEIDLQCTNHARVCSFMHAMFSTLHAKRGTIADEKISTLKDNLNLVRLKWKVSTSKLFYLIFILLQKCYF